MQREEGGWRRVWREEGCEHYVGRKIVEGGGVFWGKGEETGGVLRKEEYGGRKGRRR